MIRLMRLILAAAFLACGVDLITDNFGDGFILCTMGFGLGLLRDRIILVYQKVYTKDEITPEDMALLAQGAVQTVHRNDVGK